MQIHYCKGVCLVGRQGPPTIGPSQGSVSVQGLPVPLLQVDVGGVGQVGIVVEGVSAGSHRAGQMGELMHSFISGRGWLSSLELTIARTSAISPALDDTLIFVKCCSHLLPAVGSSVPLPALCLDA